MSRPAIIISRRNSLPGGKRAVSISKIQSTTQNARKINGDGEKICSFEKRVSAFNFLQKLALDTRKDESLIIKEDRPHHYLMTIHESQNIHLNSIKPDFKAVPQPSKSVKSEKVSSFGLSETSKESKNKIFKGFFKSAKAVKTTTKLVSKEIIIGLDSILKNFESPNNKIKPPKSGKFLRKRKL